MTNEEAKVFLQSRIDLIDKYYPQVEDYREALDMAIKALEQQPCEDCISREQAIKQCGFGMTNLLIADCLRRLPSVTPKALEQTDGDCISRKDTIEWLKKVTVTDGITFKTGFEQILYDIEQMPSVTPKAGWIPVSERLPEKAGKYLVTVKNGNVYAGVYDAFSGQFQCAATAWMPLPQPYKAESEEEE